MSQRLSSTDRKLRALKDDFIYFARQCLKIKTKDAKIIPFTFNQSQQYFHDKVEAQLKTKGRVRMLVVKGRQSGISTYVAGRFYHNTSTKRAVGTFILSHEATTTDKLFKIVKLYNERSPIAPIVRRSNAKELDFETLNSQYYVGTAGSGDIGRGGTIQYFHGSEVALWKNTDDIETGVMESIPDGIEDGKGTEVILESTAKGMGNFFHRMVVDAIAGKNSYEVVFIPWYWMDEYEAIADDFEPTAEELEYAELNLQDYDEATTLRKLAWRRNKISTFGSAWKFKQEYPSNVQEAFQTTGESLCKPEDIVRARQHTGFVGNNDAPLVLGVDPARSGDRTAIVFRRGREIERVISYSPDVDGKMTDMRLAGILAKLIQEYQPIATNIDCTTSWGVHDRLKELKYKGVNGIQFGAGALESDIYLNKRVEMHVTLSEWLQGDVCIPDDDEFAIDLMATPDYKETSDSKIRLVSKEKIKEVMGLSPDLADAAALTFAVFINPLASRVPVKKTGGGLQQRRKKSAITKRRG